MLKLSVKTRQFFRRQRVPQVLWRGSALGIISTLNLWMSTLSMRVVRQDPTADPGDPNFEGPVIFVFWHEYIPFPVFVRPNCNLAMLLSQHQDAEVLSHIARFAGLDTVRGSTSRGGASALRELIDRGQVKNLAITPDGPRGPRRKLAQGCIYLSSRLQIPIVPLGIGYDRPWRNQKAWDKFALPRPFTRCRALLGPKIQIPKERTRRQLEADRQWVEEQLNELTTMAEQWAEGAYDMADSEPLFPRTRNS